MLTNACQYAIRAVLYLAMYSNETKKIGLTKIAKEEGIPQPFLAKLLQELIKNKLVSSIKGPNGGFFLNKRQKQNSVWDIITCIDGTKRFDQCFLGLSKCSDDNPCPVHFMVSPFKEKVLESFREKTIVEFVDEFKNNEKVISLEGFDSFDEQ